MKYLSGKVQELYLLWNPNIREEKGDDGGAREHTDGEKRELVEKNLGRAGV